MTSDLSEVSYFQRLAVGIMVSGFVFDEEDFVMPWEGQIDKLERYFTSDDFDMI